MLTPLDVENVKFRGALSGYDRNEVEQFRLRLIQALEDSIAQTELMRTRISDLESQLMRYHESEELLKNSVVLAQRTADELIVAAHQRADLIVQAAQLEGESIRRALGDLRAEREQFEYAFYGLLTGFIQRLEQANPGLGKPYVAPPALQEAALPEAAVPTAPAGSAAGAAPAAAATPPSAAPVAAPRPAPAATVDRSVAPAAHANVRDADAGSLMALLNAVQPEPETRTAEQPGVPAAPALQEPFAPPAPSGTQDEPDSSDQT